MKHTAIEMVKDAKYKITDEKYLFGHQFRCKCQCSDEVLNLLSGQLVWTRVQFDCGEIIKINCQCLEKISD